MSSLKDATTVQLFISPKSVESGKIVKQLTSNPKIQLKANRNDDIQSLIQYLRDKRWKLEERYEIDIYNNENLKIPINSNLNELICENNSINLFYEILQPPATSLPETLPESSKIGTILQEMRELVASPPSTPSSLGSATTTAPMTGTEKVEQMYQMMLDRERSLFISVLENQAKWMTEMSNQMLTKCLEIQKENFEFNENRLKKN
jgi:hypothetical protein